MFSVPTQLFHVVVNIQVTLMVFRKNFLVEFFGPGFPVSGAGHVFRLFRRVKHRWVKHRGHAKRQSVENFGPVFTVSVAGREKKPVSDRLAEIPL